MPRRRIGDLGHEASEHSGKASELHRPGLRQFRIPDKTEEAHYLKFLGRVEFLLDILLGLEVDG